ncbi:cytochrome P450 [Pseudanabaena sp. FACHB-1998]|uniref:cytochrome P450 n=1 Tax=Pseudanabaena sp. FACHB-1998 TaxID=2692858 RepID=UPI001680B222|nr:cytochrome P450 [Pseudanabaena sp. FACHB-1998]
MENLQTPQGELGLPIIGETLNFLLDPNYALKKKQQYGNVFKTRIFGSPSVFMIGAEANQFIFANENKYFDVNWPASTKALLGNMSLAMQSGHTHTSRRKLMVQAFQPRALASYTPEIISITAQYFQRWEQMGTLTWYGEIRDYTFDVASKTLVNTSDGSQTKLSKYFYDWADGLFSIPLQLPWTKFGKAMQARKQIRELLGETIQARQQLLDRGDQFSKEAIAKDAIAILLNAEDEQGHKLSLDELKDQILVLLFAGHETLTSAIASFCLLLAQHPDVCDRARAEQMELIQSNSEINADTLKQMPYLDAVMKEVLRFVPPVGGAFRKTKEDFEYKGFLIPQGWTVIYQINQSHQDEAVYSDPDTFNPDRFLENTNDRAKLFSYVPFGGGMRECLGKEYARLEMKIFGAMLLRQYRWELLPNQNLSLIKVPTPHPRDGLKVRFYCDH